MLALGVVPGLALANQDGDLTGDAAFCAPAGLPLDASQCTFADGVLGLDFEASSGPQGENAVGSGSFHIQGGFFAEFDITCLEVSGNRASFGGPTTSLNIGPPGGGIAFQVIDNGPAGDLLLGSSQYFPASLVPGLPDCGVGFFQVDPLQGDVVVRDCVRFKDKPGTDKDKCKIK
jgi:hypothetical protein